MATPFTAATSAREGELDRTTEPTLRELQLSFGASASEYFRIWIVNTVLSLSTLGLYSAWAKVRTRQYFYGHTVLDGTPFHYGAPPFTLFKARLIGTLLMAAYFVTTTFYVELTLYALAAAAIAAPWIWLRSHQFEARWSSFRGLPFRARGTYISACRTLLGAAGLAATVLGLPWAYCRIKSYLFRNLSYGGVPARLACRGERLFRSFLLATCLAVLGVGLGVGMLVWGLANRYPIPDWALPGCVLPLYGGVVLARSIVEASGWNAVSHGARLGPLRFASTLRASDLLRIYVTNTIAIVLSLGLLTPWAVVRLARYRLEHLRVYMEEDWDAFAGSPEAVSGAEGHPVAEALMPNLPVSS